MNSPHYSLSQLLTIVRTGFEQLFAEFDFWFLAEVGRVTSVKGRRYFDFVEFGAQHDICAKARGILRDGTKVSSFLQQTNLQQTELVGLKLLCHGNFHFHPEYGFSIAIDTISVEYTLGQLQKKQQDILSQLKQLGIATKNKATNLGYPPYTIAVISSPSSQGLQDFCTVLEDSQFLFCLVPYYAAIHGNEAKEAVHAQLQAVYADRKNGKKIDAVAILRGGGGSSGIMRQNDFNIAKGICWMPVPVFVAVGHTADTSVLDSIARFPAKTPTDAAHMLLQETAARAERALVLRDSIAGCVQQKLGTIQQKIEFLRQRIGAQCETKQQILQNNVAAWRAGISSYTPEHMRRRGYATLHDADGKYVSKEKISGLQKGDELVIRVYDKTFSVVVEDSYF